MPNNKLRVEAYRFGPFLLDLIVCQLFYRDRPVRLASRTFDILKMLVVNKGRVVTKEELIKQVWPDRFVEENNLTVRMSALRKALGESPENRFVETVPGYGYRFVARVNELLGENKRATQDSFDSLAVLPFINENNQQKLNYLCDGITEGLISSLSHIANLKVMARSTVFRYKAHDVDPQRVGEELGVNAVLVGKVNQIKNNLAFSIEMIEVADGSYLWGATYNRHASDLIALQEEITREVSDKLRITLSKIEESQVAKRHTDNPRAHHLYMKGRYFWNKRRVDTVKKAIGYFRSAIKEDPRYALAYTGLADAYFTLSSYGLWDKKRKITGAREAALKALELDNRLAEPHVSLANVKSSFELDWEGAGREYRLAIECNPFYAPARQYYANYLAKLGELDEAIAEINKAYEIDPLSLSVNLAMGKIYFYARRLDEALTKGRELLELEPGFGPANGLIGMVYLERGCYSEAINEFKIMMEFSAGEYGVTRGARNASAAKSALPDYDPEALALLGYAYARSGKRAKALRVLGELEELIKIRYVEPHTLALVHIGLGDSDKAFQWLERAFMDRSNTLTFIKVAPFFDSIRDDPRHGRLVRRLGLQALS